MEPKIALSDAQKRIVEKGYDACGPRYSAARVDLPNPEVGRLLGSIRDGAAVLDIGCGAGVPVTASIAGVCKVVGVDVSSAQVEQARRNVPAATFLHGDIMSMNFEPGSFDAVLCLYTLFHLPRDEHRVLLERVARWLRPGGHLLLTVAKDDHPGYTEPDFFGVTMYWSHFCPSWYVATLRDLGFEILVEGALGHGYHDDSDLPPEHHPVLFARLEHQA